MYVPKHFAHDDHADLMAVMREHAFATVFAAVDGEPFATHAPVRVTRSDNGIVTIEGHVARANPHAAALAGARAMVVFQGPHTYISPTLYRSSGRVPTWNYIAVHAVGRVRTINAADEKRALLTRLIADHEPSFNETFAHFDARHRDGLLAAITGFEIVVDKLEGKFKLGQNRLADNLPAMQVVHEEGDADRRSIAQWMKRLGYWS
ncbi:MAG: FMN-binding negative transcriptional regulator [Burkholderiaceae bacterium]